MSDLPAIQNLFPDGLGAGTPEAASWLCFFEEKVEVVERVRGLPRLEAERVAFEIVLVEYLNATHPDTDPSRCAECGGHETPDAALSPIGASASHAWLHQDCWAPWRERRRAEAIDQLAAMKIEARTPSSARSFAPRLSARSTDRSQFSSLTPREPSATTYDPDPVSESDELRDPRSLFDEPPKPAPAARSEPAIRPDGQRACAICGAPAYFGFGVSIRGGREGRWACMEHREAVECTRGS